MRRSIAIILFFTFMFLSMYYQPRIANIYTSETWIFVMVLLAILCIATIIVVNVVDPYERQGK